MRKVDGVDWDWTLYEHEGTYYLSVFCDGVASFDLDVALTPEERAVWDREGAAGLGRIAEAIRYRPAEHMHRKVELPA